MDEVKVKHEGIENLKPRESSRNPEPSKPIYVIDLSSTDSDSDESSSSSDDDCSVSGINGKRSRVSTGAEGGLSKKRKEKKNMEELGVPLPAGFLDPLPAKRAPSSPLSAARKPQSAFALNANENVTLNANANANVEKCKQFWKSGDYEGLAGGDWDTSSGGMDHVRVHPKFLHSNATSHKWVLGAFAELLDNSLDEVCNGATFVNMDMLENKKDGSRMLLIEDNGGGMDPDKMRQCMSLGYSLKSKIANTIGQYGNGFKTSTMRLGADVIVFSRCCGRDGKRPTQSIGLLSYTFLRSTWKEDILVPMLDYERGGLEWNRMIRSSASDWNINVQTMLQWSPFSSEVDLLRQFNQMKDHGTRIIIYNLWEDDKGQLELDFDTDPYDIQIRGANRDEKNIQMAKQYPNSKHFLTYKHSLRSYASILYIRIPAHFRIILRGKDVEHHNVVNDMMMSREITYRPQPDTDGVPKDSHMFAVVTIGFVKDAKAHINVQGFNVYHKNRLIKPFWRVWNAAGSGGRGIIGVLEANFVEPAHDKQGFERTIVLSRLEIKLIQMQKSYWMKYCHKIGYVSWCKKNHIDERGMPPDYIPRMPSPSKTKNTGSSSEIPISVSDKFHSHSNWKQGTRKSKRYLRTVDKTHVNGHACTEGGNRTKIPAKSGKGSSSSETSDEDVSNNEMQTALPERRADGVSQKALPADKPSWKDEFRGSRSFQNIRNTEAEQDCALKGRPVQSTMRSQSTEDDVGRSEFSPSNSNLISLAQLKEEKRQLRERLKRKEEDILGDIMRDLQHERDRCQSLENKLKEALLKIEELNKEQENLIDIFAEERQRRDTKEENLRKKLKDASNSIQELLDKVRLLEKKSPSSN